MNNLYIVLIIWLASHATSYGQEQEFFMGSSQMTDSTATVNEMMLTQNPSIKKFYNYNGIKLKDDVKYGRYGIDISKWQGKIDWSHVKLDSLPDKIHFVIVKATQGSTLVDREFINNVNAVRKNNFILGCYHFYNQKADPVLQANNFIKNVKLQKGDFMPIVDIERNCYLDCGATTDLLISKDSLVKSLKIYISKIEQHYKTKVIIYTNEAFYNDYLLESFKDYYFWIAKYSNTPPKCFEVGGGYSPDNPCYKSMKKGCWQYTQSGKVQGISTNVDLNFINNFYLLKWQIQQ